MGVEVKIIGVDPGKTGAVAIIDSMGVELIKMPLTKEEDINFDELADIICDHQQDARVFIEKVHAMPKQGVSSMFTFGMGYGALLGIVAAHRLPLYLVRPQQWQKVMLAGVTGEDTKARAVLAAKLLHPTIDFLGSPRAKKPHSGKVDALLIAEYGRRMMK